MAYNKEEIYNLAVLSVDKENLYFIEDVISFLPISKPTFYDYFKVDSNELNYIKELLDGNKIRTKLKLRKKLAEGDKAAEILALYKLIATEDERRALSMQHIDHTTKGEQINIISLGNGTKPNETP
jgi:hypothetical protein